MNLPSLLFLFHYLLFQNTRNFCFPYQQEADSKVWGPTELTCLELEKMTSLLICKTVHIAPHLLGLMYRRITQDEVCKAKCVAQRECFTMINSSTLPHTHLHSACSKKTFLDKMSTYVKKLTSFPLNKPLPAFSFLFPLFSYYLNRI